MIYLDDNSSFDLCRVFVFGLSFVCLFLCRDKRLKLVKIITCGTSVPFFFVYVTSIVYISCQFSIRSCINKCVQILSMLLIFIDNKIIVFILVELQFFRLNIFFSYRLLLFGWISSCISWLVLSKVCKYSLLEVYKAFNVYLFSNCKKCLYFFFLVTISDCSFIPLLSLKTLNDNQLVFVPCSNNCNQMK